MSKYVTIIVFVAALRLFAVDVTPSVVNFECEPLGGQSLSAQAIGFAGIESGLNEPNFLIPSTKSKWYSRIEQEIADKGSTNVIVSFNFEHIDAIGADVWEKIDFCRSQIVNDTAVFNCGLRRAFENVPAIHLNVNSDALAYLKNSPFVSFIEPVITINECTAQGVPLMDGDVYRTAYSGSGLSIAVIDSGINYTHPAFGGGGFPNAKVIGGYDFGSGDADPLPVGSTHGTSVAGIAAGDITNNGSYPNYIGGLAYGSKLYALKVMPDNSSSTDTAILTSAIDWCVSHKNDDPANPILVINMSVGGGRYLSTCDSASAAMTNAVNAAVAAGITILASSGNEGYCDSIGIPACLSNVISVGAVFDSYIGTVSFAITPESCLYTGSSYYSVLTAADKVAPYSNSASFLDILAPSHNATTPSTATGYTNSFGGSSAACPYAAGSVAVLQSAAKDIIGRFLTFTEVRDIITQNGEPVEDFKNGITKPRVNLANAIDFTDVFNGSQITLTNTSKNFTSTVSSITYPQWLRVYPSAPISIAKNKTATLYAQAACQDCDYEDLSGSIVITGSTPSSTNYSRTVTANMNCPDCGLQANFNGGCEVNLEDLAIFTDCWLSADTSCLIADINDSGIVSLDDFDTIAAEWLTGY